MLRSVAFRAAMRVYTLPATARGGASEECGHAAPAVMRSRQVHVPGSGEKLAANLRCRPCMMTAEACAPSKVGMPSTICRGGRTVLVLLEWGCFKDQRRNLQPPEFRACWACHQEGTQVSASSSP